MSVFDKHKDEAKEENAPVAEPQPEGADGPGGASAPAPKRDMTRAEAEEVLDRLHYCKKHGKKMELQEDEAYHCEIDDKEKADEEAAEAKAAWAVFSKGLKPEGKK